MNTPYICNKVGLTQYTNGKTLLDGSILEGIEVLAWAKPLGRKLIWMDEMGSLKKKAVAGFILVRWAELAEKDLPTARRAILTNSNDLATALSQWPDKLEAPPMVWLGITRRYNLIEDSEDVGLPSWAWGYQVVEAEEPIGCFAALGYGNPGDEARFKIAKQYYCQLLVEEINGGPLSMEGRF